MDVFAFYWCWIRNINVIIISIRERVETSFIDVVNIYFHSTYTNIYLFQLNYGNSFFLFVALLNCLGKFILLLRFFVYIKTINWIVHVFILNAKMICVCYVMSVLIPNYWIFHPGSLYITHYAHSTRDTLTNYEFYNIWKRTEKSNNNNSNNNRIILLLFNGNCAHCLTYVCFYFG